LEILATCRGWTDGIIRDLSAEQRVAPTALGGGTWTVKDLLGHLATHEHRALLVLGCREVTDEDEAAFGDVHAFNEYHLEKKRAWTLHEVETDYEATRDELVRAIGAVADEKWLEKIPHGGGRSAMALVLGKMLNGDKYGLYAHDFAHRRGLEEAAAAFK
jgi:hypothetical protein